MHHFLFLQALLPLVWDALTMAFKSPKVLINSVPEPSIRWQSFGLGHAERPLFFLSLCCWGQPQSQWATAGLKPSCFVHWLAFGFEDMIKVFKEEGMDQVIQTLKLWKLFLHLLHTGLENLPLSVSHMELWGQCLCCYFALSFKGVPPF